MLHITPTESLGLMVFSALAIVWAISWSLAQAIIYFTEDEEL